MAKCKNCRNLLAKEEISIGHLHSYKWCPVINDNLDDELERDCDDFECMTNADRIRNMTDEELAWFLCKVKADYQWIDQEFPREDEGGEWEEWLKSEVGCE